MNFLRNKPRTYKEASEKGGVKENTLYKQLILYKKGGLVHKRNRTYYRFLMNLPDDVLDFYLNDENFNGFKAKLIDKKEVK